jgi:hypothetical protein
MEDNSYLPEYGDDDVLSLESGKLFKVGRFREAVKSAFTDENQVPSWLSSGLRKEGVEVGTSDTKKMLEQGIDGEVLMLGSKGWQKGKIRIRISVEFCPDEPEITQPESPLDDIHQRINQETP